MRRGIGIYCAGLTLLLLWLAAGMLQRVIEKRPLVPHDVVVNIEKGDSLDTIALRLTEERIPLRTVWFKYYVFRLGLARRLKAGEYEIKRNMTAADIARLLASGKTRQYAITFPEGWSYRQLLQLMRENPNLLHTLDANNPGQVLAELASDKPLPEGLFFPDTYFFEKNTADIALLKRAYAKMRLVLDAEWRNRDPDTPLTDAYQALILASIIEKETAIPDERAKIAGVFSRRLRKKMLLQTDPTVIYGMGDAYAGNISSEDLRTPTPYNTYLQPGLPPTPIAMPGQASIAAALHPEPGAALYFVARGDGGHMFANTLAEHEKYVNQFQKQ